MVSRAPIPAPVTFTVTGDWVAVNDPALTAPASDPQLQPVNALVTFTPRLPRGFVSYVKDFPVPDDAGSRTADAGIVLTQRLGRILIGRLCAVDVTDSLGVVLAACDPALGLDELIYDIAFTKVQFGPLSGRMENFAIRAPKTSTTVRLTDPELERLPWQKPTVL